MPRLTPSQTIGPFFGVLTRHDRFATAASGLPGERIVVAGQVRDGDGAAVPDALVEIWQADPAGRWPHPDADGGAAGGFTGFTRAPTDGGGRYRVETIRPGGAPGSDERTQAPHLLVGLFARGLLRRLVTRIYFGDDPALGDDPILALVPASRRGTLIAARRDAGRYEHDLVLQGAGETVFFDV